MRVPIPFYRFSPQLDEAISPGETNDEKLVELIIKTKLYLSQKVCTNDIWLYIYYVYIYFINLLLLFKGSLR